MSPRRLQPDCSESRLGACDASGKDAARGASDGRRLYIHQSSFDFLAMQSPTGAELTYSALVALSVVKLVHHDVVEEGVALGLVRSSTAERLLAMMEATWLPRVSTAFRRIMLGDRPLIAEDESIMATCVDANYFTFATGEGSARRMYADFLKLSEVWKLVQSGSRSYRDVTMVKGRGLSWRTESASPSVASFDVDEVKRAVLLRFVQELAHIILASSPEEEELPHLTEFRERCCRAVRGTILRLGRNAS